MLPKADIIGKIQQLYMDNRPVPYLTFMGLLGDLVEDLVQMVPREPADDLREKFRAACMCANVGVVDNEGRGEMRVSEFREKVCEFWRTKVPAEEFAKYDDVLQGNLRQKRALAAHERGVDSDAASDRSKQLLSKLGLAEAEEAPASAASVVAASPEVTVPRGVALQFDSVDAVCAAVREGSLHTLYLPREEARDLARYDVDNVPVTIKLARANDRNYTVLTAGIGHGRLSQAEESIDDAAAEMAYVRMAPFAYMRDDGEFVYTLSAGPAKTNLACASQVTEDGEDLCLRLQKMHRDLGELVERLQALDASTTLIL